MYQLKKQSKRDTLIPKMYQNLHHIGSLSPPQVGLSVVGSWEGWMVPPPMAPSDKDAPMAIEAFRV
jgi:hypothetical protein